MSNETKDTTGRLLSAGEINTVDGTVIGILIEMDVDNVRRAAALLDERVAVVPVALLSGISPLRADAQSLRSRLPYDVRGTVIYAGPREHDVAVGEVYDNGQPHPEELAKIWAAADRIMFPTLAWIRNAAREKVSGIQGLRLDLDVFDLLNEIADRAGGALPVTTIGDAKEGAGRHPTPEAAAPCEGMERVLAEVFGRPNPHGDDRISVSAGELRALILAHLCGGASPSLQATGNSLLGRAATPEVARPLEEWTEEMGDVLWWKFPVTEAPYVGSPVCLGQTVEIHSYKGVVARGQVGGWPGYHTHFTPLPPVPVAPKSPRKGGKS